MSQLHKQHVVIVDPLSGGQFLVDEFNSRGISCVAVLSCDVPECLVSSFKSEKYVEVINYSQNFDELTSALKKYKPKGIMIGVETGLALMDRLAEYFGLPGNNPQTSDTRRDKYLMQETIRNSGLKAVEQCKVNNIEKARYWLANYNKYPVIVKPAESAASDSVYFCDSSDDAIAAVKKILSTKNIFGFTNFHALIQEYLEGDEWVVDTVSCDGECKVTNITKYSKTRTTQGKWIYKHSAFLSPNKETQGDLIQYAKKIIKALGIEFGSAHVEIIDTECGPILVEVNARMHGGDAVVVLKDYAPFTQLDLSVDSFVAPEAFAVKAKQEVDYSHHVVAHFLISKISGEVHNVMEGQRLREIGSYVSDHMPSVGDKLKVTDNLTSAPGYIWLANLEFDSLKDDQKILRDLEEQGLIYS